ncbi:hypothetical protein SK128_010231 [Halocaridina rubra]|uniref:Uncharacterized protein n=1 Tax=Halocaridina rubra TaxID=373956 RepID=A0AAN8XGH1_HALRR
MNELTDCHSQPLIDEDLEEMTKSTSEEEAEEQPEETHEKVEEPGLTLERLAAMYERVKAVQLSQERDDNMVRSVTLCNLLDDAMTPYKTICQQQQLPFTMFFFCKKQPATQLCIGCSSTGERLNGLLEGRQKNCMCKCCGHVATMSKL